MSALRDTARELWGHEVVLLTDAVVNLDRPTADLTAVAIQAPTRNCSSAASMNGFQTSVADALETLQNSLGLDAEALFGERVVEPAPLPGDAVHAFGFIEGAASAMGVTALELLDEIDAL